MEKGETGLGGSPRSGVSVAPVAGIGKRQRAGRGQAPGKIANNFGCHKGLLPRQLVGDAGAHLLFLPPQSRDLNPTEIVLAKLKTLFRKADERTIGGSWRHFGTILDHFTPPDCQRYFNHAGCASV